MYQKHIKLKASLSTIIPIGSRIRLISVWLVTLFFLTLGSTFINANMSPWIAATGFIILLAAIIYASFGVVKEADELAHKLGEPYGTLILTLSVVAIEVILISAVLLGPGDNPTIGKDSIFSVMMIILNLVTGLCILLGGLKYGEQEYNAQGSLSYLAMIILLGGIGLLLPNYITGSSESTGIPGVFTTAQAGILSSLVVILYGCFLYFQIKTYRHLYIQPPSGSLEIKFAERNFGIDTTENNTHIPHQSAEIWIRGIMLILMLLPIVLLSHNLAVVIDYGISAAELPTVLGGILIAIIVFTPESITSVKAALKNEFQRAINLCLGAFVSTVGLSIPAVLIVGLIAGKTVQFGLTGTETVLFITTVALSLMSFLGKRTTPMIGVMHLVLFAVFMMLVFFP